MSQILLNNVFSKLAAAVAPGDVTINVTAGEGALFALATGGDTIRATLVKVSGYREIAWEIVDITARSTDALTVTRAREGTSALSFAIGDVVDVRMTAGTLSSAWTAYTPTITAGSGTFTTVSAAGVYQQIGKVVHFQMTITITSVGTAATYVASTLPVTAKASGFNFVGREMNVTGAGLLGNLVSTTQLRIRKLSDDTFHGGNGYSLTMSGTYEAA